MLKLNTTKIINKLQFYVYSPASTDWNFSRNFIRAVPKNVIAINLTLIIVKTNKKIAESINTLVIMTVERTDEYDESVWRSFCQT